MTKRRNEHAINEFVVTVAPVFIGDGIPLIARRHRHVPLDLRSVERFDYGVVNFVATFRTTPDDAASKLSIERLSLTV